MDFQHASHPFLPLSLSLEHSVPNFCSFLLHDLPNHVHDLPVGGIFSLYGRSNRGCDMMEDSFSTVLSGRFSGIHG